MFDLHTYIILPSFSLFSLTAGMVYGCPGADWYSYLGSCYLVNVSNVNWHQAQDYCTSRGSVLASINDQNEQNYISSTLPCK